ncbi:alpha-ketoglutarate-dependent dioxygenase alkB homolog 7, mitochondrial [Condylostylus longicornis]|uniref:alpha-ketoglutarate-dependent dioxygenase alkB homolog 7, mitochondrial n=1 Tax=Condylostylus longicornis TaxID=2530218 RepID=UPI00244E1EF3|nr:alpha-ketoglutarate-dependent dioxygenase alkB homolog 7, mitochondrial [Condylostylus longicornis]
MYFSTKIIKNVLNTSIMKWGKGSCECYPKYKVLSRYCMQKHSSDNIFIDFHGNWPETEKSVFLNEMRVLPNFLSNEEEAQLLDEVEPYLKRLRYEFDHWDDAIHGYRETERKHWYPHNRKTIQRISDVAFNGQIMSYIHILDLDEKGVIKPHVDSTRYCGDTIAGMSLLSNSVMRLIRTDEKKYQQNKTSEDVDSSYRNQPKPSTINNFYADILLPRLSLYIMSHSARYNFTHEILANENSQFKGEKILKTRRISIICRNEP